MSYPLGKTQKNLRGGGIHPLPPLYIRGLIELCSETCIKQNWIRGLPSIKQPHAKVLENWPVLSCQLYQVVVIIFCPNSQVIFYCLHP